MTLNSVQAYTEGVGRFSLGELEFELREHPGTRRRDTVPIGLILVDAQWHCTVLSRTEVDPLRTPSG